MSALDQLLNHRRVKGVVITRHRKGLYRLRAMVGHGEWDTAEAPSVEEAAVAVTHQLSGFLSPPQMPEMDAPFEEHLVNRMMPKV